MNDYQQKAARTLIDKPGFEVSDSDLTIIWNAIKLSAVIGRLCERVKKGIFHQHGLDKDELNRDLLNIIGGVGKFYSGESIEPVNLMILWNTIGLAGETGEICDLVTRSDFDKASKEIGDALWYLAALCTKLGLDMNEVMEENIRKLTIRYPNGYNSEDSRKRVDVY